MRRMPLDQRFRKRMSVVTTPAAYASDPRKVELVLGQLDALPALAPVVTRILSLTQDARGSVRDLAQLVASDPSLTASVLSICARAHQGVRSEGLTAEKAVGLLGFDAIRQITLASKIMEAFSGAREPEREPGLERGDFWRHCLAVACAARRIAAALGGPVDPEEAFLYGLLHDIGKIAFDSALPKSYARVLRRAAEHQIDISDAERHVLGVDHAVAGRRLAERWGLAPALVDVIWLHHHPPEALPATIAAGGHVQIVLLADVLVREHGIGYSGNHRVPVSSRAIAAQMGLSEAARVGIVESLAEELEARAAWIGQEQTTSREVYLRALIRTGEELSAANAQLVERNDRLQRTAQYLSALDELNRTMSPSLAVREVCAIGAASIRNVLSVASVVLFAAEGESRWVELGFSDGRETARLDERPEGVPHDAADRENAVRLAEAGAWIAPAPGGFGWLLERVASDLGDGPFWLLPVVCRRRWVGGVLFSADGETVGRLSGEAAELAALSGAVGLAITHAQARVAARRLADDLADANRRLADIQPDLIRARVLESIVAMAAGAAHELNNPLAVISGRAQVLQKLSADPELLDGLARISAQAQACSDIVTQLMEFARPEAPSPEEVDVGVAISDVVSELDSARLLERGAVRIEVEPGLRKAWFDRAALREIVRELLDNSIEATAPESRFLTVKAASDLTEESIVVHVVDNGRGMTPDVLGRAFDPFFSYRPAGRGRGLGLSRVQRRLHAGGGMIRIASEPGRGTRVEFRVPVRRT